MKLYVFTITLDGMPWLPVIYANLNATGLDWKWIVVEGVAAPVNCTSHCQSLPPRLSNDGTTQFMESLATDPRVAHIKKELWQGKVEMCNAALATIKEPCLLMEMDSDEIWLAHTIDQFYDMVEKDFVPCTAYQFRCRYFLGPGIVTHGFGAYGNYTEYEWIRAWTFLPGMTFNTHEPPVMSVNYKSRLIVDIIFDHYAWFSRKQVEFKCAYYGYANGVEGWERLQKNTVWPAKLKDYLPWVDDNAQVIKSETDYQNQLVCNLCDKAFAPKTLNNPATGPL